MSILTLVYPAQAAISVAQNLTGSVAVIGRSALGLGVFSLVAIITIVFKPLIVGLVHTTHFVMRPRVSVRQRLMRRRLEGFLLLNRLAKEADVTQPNLAGELRYLAARG